MIVVADTSPINYLCQIEQIELLPALFGQVVLPQAVVHELQHSATPSAVQQFIVNAPRWIEVRAPISTDATLDEFGIGERQAITLAQEISADLLIIDDRAARRAAEHRNITVIGTLGIIKLAADRSMVDLSGTIALLQACGFYISEQLLQDMLGEY